jgi:hypothetical protein
MVEAITMTCRFFDYLGLFDLVAIVYYFTLLPNVASSLYLSRNRSPHFLVKILRKSP